MCALALKSQALLRPQVLTYGLLTAAILRLGMIIIGVELIENFQPVLLGFAGILLFSAYGLVSKNEEDDGEDLSDNGVVRFCRFCSRLNFASSLLKLQSWGSLVSGSRAWRCSALSHILSILSVPWVT